MKNLQNSILTLVHILQSRKVLKSFYKIPLFDNEKENLIYVTNLKSPILSSRAINDLIGFGFSFMSPELSFVKSLGEGIERYSSYWINKESVIFSSYLNLQQDAMNLSQYTNNKLIDRTTIGWVDGYNVSQNKRCLLPAQLIYYNYPRCPREIVLSPSVIFGSGGASGISHETTLLSGIYEIVERDAFMTGYLNNIPSEKIEIKNTKHRLLKKIQNKLDSHNLTLYLFEISNDLEIPTFFSIIEERTGDFFIGLKSNITSDRAIIGSIEESLLEKTVKKNYLLKKTTRSKEKPALSKRKIKKLYLDQQITRLFNIQSIKTPPNNFNELSLIVSRLKAEGFEIYYKDITPIELKLTNFFVYKVIIPKMQPLFFVEQNKEIRQERIKTVKEFFRNKKHYS